jgi:H+/Cl- antiporter ClcA
MSMPNQQPTSWKSKAYAFGAVVGAVFGLLSAFMYTRAAEEDVNRLGKPNRASTGELIGLGLAGLAMVRQIAEMGRPPKKSK